MDEQNQKRETSEGQNDDEQPLSQIGGPFTNSFLPENSLFPFPRDKEEDTLGLEESCSDYSTSNEDHSTVRNCMLEHKTGEDKVFVPEVALTGFYRLILLPKVVARVVL